MGLLTWVTRQKQSRGHGVHSPFAYNLIKKVFHSPYSYYAFFDIPERAHIPITPFNKLSFQLVNYFHARTILEIYPGDGVNTRYLLAPSSEIQCTSVESANEAAFFIHSINKRFDAIFINTARGTLPTVDELLELGHENSFWVIHSIRNRQGKHFWKQIVNDKRIRVTFDKRDTGIVFLEPSITPSHYLI